MRFLTRLSAGTQNVATPTIHQDEVHGSRSIADGADMTPDDAGGSENAGKSLFSITEKQVHRDVILYVDLRKSGHVPQGGDRTAAQADTCGGHPPLGSHQVDRRENDHRSELWTHSCPLLTP